MNLKELLEARAKLYSAICEMRDAIAKENRPFTAEEDDKWARINGEYNDLAKRIDVMKRGEALEKEHADELAAISSFPTQRTGVERQEAPITEESKELAFRGWIKLQGKRCEPTQAEMDAIKRLNFNPSINDFEVSGLSPSARAAMYREARQVHPNQREHVYQRNLSAFTPQTGGYTTLPASLVQAMEINMLAYGGVESVARQINTSSGERLLLPTMDDTTNTGAQLAEGGSISTSVDPSFGQVALDAYKFSSKPVLVPYELLQDSQFPIASFIGEALGVRLGRIKNTRFTTGTGAGTCKGIVTAASAGVTTASGTAITSDELLGLVHSIDPAYRSIGCGWMMNDGVLLYLRKLKDANSRPLWSEMGGQDGFTTGAPDRLLGYPITINQDMQSTVATATVTMLFGQLNKYIVRTVGGPRFYHLVERYRDNDLDAFITFIRCDGNLLTAGTAPVKKMTQA